MLYLILAIATSAMISLILRLGSEKAKNNIAILAVNYITATTLSVLYLEPGSFSQPGLGVGTAMAALNGVLYVGGLVLMQWNISKNGVVLTSTYVRLGLIMCMALSVLLFQEVPTAVQLAGFLLAVTAIILNGGQTGGAKFRPGLLLMLLVSGISDTWVKCFGVWGNPDLSSLFLLGTFLVACVLCLGFMVYQKQRIGFWEVVFGIAVAVPNYFNSKFLLLSLQTLPGVIVYPTFSVAALLTITVCGVCLFRERLSRRQWAAMGLILVALVLLNL